MDVPRYVGNSRQLFYNRIQKHISPYLFVNILTETEQKKEEKEMTQTGKNAHSMMDQETLDTLNNLTNDEKSSEESSANMIDLDNIDVNTLTPEIIAKMNPQQLSEAFKRAQAASDNKKKVVVEKPVFKLTKLQPNQKISLSELVSLDKTPIKNASQGMRPLDRSNVQSLVSAYESNDKTRLDKIPPIQLQGSTMGPIVVAGYHRTEAQRLAILNKFLGNPLMCDKDGNLTQAAHTEYQNTLKTFYVKYVPVNYSEAELPVKAYMDNFTNGLPPTETGRSNFGLFLYQHYKEQGIKKTWEEISNIVGVTRQAMNAQKHRNDEIEKPKKNTVKIAMDDLEPEVRQEIEELINQKDSKRRPDVLESSFRQIINASIRICDEQVSEGELNAYLQDMVKDDRAYQSLIKMSHILQVIPPTATQA